MVQKNGGKMTNSLRRVDKFGTILYINENNKLHREDGPARICSDGTQVWHKNGFIYRENGPSVIFSDGNRSYYKKE